MFYFYVNKHSLILSFTSAVKKTALFYLINASGSLLAQFVCFLFNMALNATDIEKCSVCPFPLLSQKLSSFLRHRQNMKLLNMLLVVILGMTK